MTPTTRRTSTCQSPIRCGTETKIAQARERWASTTWAHSSLEPAVVCATNAGADGMVHPRSLRVDMPATRRSGRSLPSRGQRWRPPHSGSRSTTPKAQRAHRRTSADPFRRRAAPPRVRRRCRPSPWPAHSCTRQLRRGSVRAGASPTSEGAREGRRPSIPRAIHGAARTSCSLCASDELAELDPLFKTFPSATAGTVARNHEPGRLWQPRIGDQDSRNNAGL